ncbi:Retrovirus-related Pol polyprotein from type-1 retrotransposable element R2 [Eumeta japonica]|uniref:Retrovirus-related Pol polyprotein from type-1 retrotransposable element R2 n=1 Tax=Eumeta variegata TaxID=151549 RepID=A0A4C1YPK7_EUMVA|nr:Retrovirus-related Pol polyprotein from type-1 retrotransposable element R2 [Eumeta japonica]
MDNYKVLNIRGWRWGGHGSYDRGLGLCRTLFELEPVLTDPRPVTPLIEGSTALSGARARDANSTRSDSCGWIYNTQSTAWTCFPHEQMSRARLSRTIHVPNDAKLSCVESESKPHIETSEYDGAGVIFESFRRNDDSDDAGREGGVLRLSPIIEAKQPIEQAGFRKEYSNVDHIHIIEMIIEKYQELQRPFYITFIDYQKTFDSVKHLRRIKFETLGSAFHIERGIRQGDPLSPTIFIAILESIMNGLDWSKTGLHIKGAYLSHLRFADDLVLLSETVNEMQSMIESTKSEYEMRMPDKRWTTRVTQWRGPPGKMRRRGRPLTRWEEDLKRSAGSDWYSIAQDRQKWTSLEEAFTQTGILVEQ